MTDGEGQTVGVRGITQDVTERVALVDEVRANRDELATINENLEARIQQRTRDLKDAIEELEAFSAAVAHDLRGPVSVMVMNAELLSYHLRLGDMDGAVEKTGNIQRSGLRAVAMMDALLASARVSQGAVCRASVDLTAMAYEVVDE
jgi:signal transduction histidine kinase